MYPIVHRDYETRSEPDLKKVGAHAYAEHPSTEILCAVWIIEYGRDAFATPILWRRGQPFPGAVASLIENRATVAGHNAAFEHAIDTYHAGPKLGWPVPKLEQLDCTMARAAVQAIPLDLDRACRALGLPFQKDKEGHRLMLQMCKPRKPRKGEPATMDCRVCSGVGCAGRRPEDAYEGPSCDACDGTGEQPAVYWHFDEDKLARLIEYCVADVRAEIGLDHALRPLQDQERPVWLLDQVMNNRGVEIDTEFVTTAKAFVARAVERANIRMAQVTGGAVTAVTQVDRLKNFAKSHGVEFKLVEKTRRNGEEYEAEAADKEALQDLLAGPLPEPVKHAFELRLEAGKSSLKKLDKFVTQAPNGRARGNLQYHAAGPGRWAGRGIQLQNSERRGVDEPGGWDQAYRDLCELDDETVEMVGGSVFDVVSRMMRGAVIAKKGHKLYFADFANVEARGGVWSAGQHDMVALFASGGLIYEEMASSIFGISVEEVLHLHKTKQNIIPRFVGKETVLGCGFGMGPPAFQRNCKKKGRILLPIETCIKGVGGWRERNPRVVTYWDELEDAAKHAIEAPEKVFSAGPFSYRVKGKWLQCRLPSGRIIWYRRPRLKWVEKEITYDGEKIIRRDLKIHYWGVNGVTKQWEEETTWGGKLLENCDQGMCSDFLRGALLRLEAAEYWPILSVHDEPISEVPEGFGSVAEYVKIVSEVPQWAPGFPLKAEGGSGTRYAKA